MKKVLFMLAVVVGITVPLGVEAAKFEKGEAVVECTTETCTVEVDLFILPSGTEAEEFKFDTPITGSVEEGRLVTDIEIVKSGDNFNFEITGALDSNEAKLTPKEPTYSLTERQLFATVKWTYTNEVDHTSEDCSVKVNLDTMTITVEPEVTPETGMNLPLIILGLSAVAGIGVYMVTRKNTKMFKF